MADVMADSGYTEEQVFDLGISRAIVFLVVVPLMGACRVPPEALSHFMAGDDDYIAEGMPEHYSGALSGRWTIKRERLRILPATWGKWVTDVEDIQALCERQAEDATPSPAPVGQATETREQRQDRRLNACIDAGLPMDTKAALSRLPDGVGDVADREGVTRQAFSTDVKAALTRRESAKREGVTVHRA